MADLEEQLLEAIDEVNLVDQTAEAERLAYFQDLATNSVAGLAVLRQQRTSIVAMLQSLAGLSQVVVSEAAHAPEHSLEVHLPFLQSVLGDFRLLPLAVGDATPEEVADVLEHVWGGDETLIVISSDLSHYLPYDTATRTDAETVQQIIRLQAGLTHTQACGATPVNGLLTLAARHALKAEVLDLRNSGDTAGDKSRVVGYSAIAFYEPDEGV